MVDPSMLDFRRELDALAALRDALRLAGPLFPAEPRAALQQLDRTWQQAEARYQELRARTTEDAQLRRELTRLVTDLREGYAALARRLDVR